jgi:hypothetical protein
MVVRLDAELGMESLAAEPALAPVTLSRRERMLRLHRRRRRQTALGALEMMAWISGSAGVLLLVFSGVLGLR